MTEKISPKEVRINKCIEEEEEEEEIDKYLNPVCELKNCET